MAIKEDKDMVEVTIHGRGGQGAITASNLLCECAFADGFKDALDIPKIGAERRGAPIQAFSKLSKSSEIKDFCGVTDADYTVVFDFTLLDIPSVVSSMSGVVLVNAPDHVNFDCIGKVEEVWVVDATGIAIKHGLVISGYPILNTLMLGAYSKISGNYSMETMKKILEKRFGSKAEKNYNAAMEAFNTVRKVRG